MKLGLAHRFAPNVSTFFIPLFCFTHMFSLQSLKIFIGINLVRQSSVEILHTHEIRAISKIQDIRRTISLYTVQYK